MLMHRLTFDSGILERHCRCRELYERDTKIVYDVIVHNRNQCNCWTRDWRNKHNEDCTCRPLLEFSGVLYTCCGAHDCQCAHKNSKLYANIVGTYERFDENGKLYITQECLNGKLHGKTRHYFPDSKINYECNYKNGKTHGIRYIISNNGVLDYEQNFIDDKYHGRYLVNYSDGHPGE